MGPNNADPTFLDIYMEGIAAGWVAVGFSDSRLMVRFVRNINESIRITNICTHAHTCTHTHTHTYRNSYT